MTVPPNIHMPEHKFKFKTCLSQGYIQRLTSQEKSCDKTPARFLCRKLVSLAGEAPATGKALYAPLKVLKDAVITVHGNGVIESIQNYSAARRGSPAPQDLGDATICPAFINAHCHLQLSHLKGQTRLGHGFMPWLESLVPLLRRPPEAEAIKTAIKNMLASGTAFAADYTGAHLPLTASIMAEENLEALFLYECFGYNEQETLQDGNLKIPAAFRAHERQSAMAGHALYSTSEAILRAAKKWCKANGRPFAVHLAESEDETEALLTGKGRMADFFRGKIYPENWKAPGLRPVELAGRLGLLGPGALAVHCVQCDKNESKMLAESGTAICLCPRSNRDIGVGRAPVEDFIKAGAMLCLGTDSLASNSDLDLRAEAAFLQEERNVPPEALLRMLTVNGAAALGLTHLGALEPGKICALAELQIAEPA